MPMTVAVRLFARARELAGADVVELAARDTVAGVREELAVRYPQAAALIACSAIAVNGEYAADGHPVGPDDEIALIPPVSGG